jgi:hypothetical protein
MEIYQSYSNQMDIAQNMVEGLLITVIDSIGNVTEDCIYNHYKIVHIGL